MPPVSGYSATLPTDVLLDSGVLYIDSTTPYGVSKGALAVDLPREFENTEFDGKFFPIVGLDRRVGGVPKISGTFIELNATKVDELEPGATVTTVVDTTTVTPHPAGDFLPSTAYRQNVRVAFRRGGGGFAVVKFAWALVQSPSLKGADKTNGEIQLDIEARQAADAANTGVAPYQILLVPSIT